MQSKEEILGSHTSMEEEQGHCADEHFRGAVNFFGVKFPLLLLIIEDVVDEDADVDDFGFEAESLACG